MDWEALFSELLKYHRGKLLGIFLGLVLGLLISFFGFWRTVFIAVCIFIGYLIGKKIDEHKSFKSLIEFFLKTRD